MPLEMKFLSDGYGIEVIGKGVVTGEEVYNLNKVIYSGDTLLRQKYQLVNFAEVEKVVASSADISRLADQDVKASKINPNIIIAVIAEHNLTFGLARMWEAHAHEAAFETMVFRERGEALAWIKRKMDERT